MEMEVIWNGGPLLPDRPEQMASIWTGLPPSRLAVLDRFLLGGDRIRTGRLCACGCGLEMTYAGNSKAADRTAIYRSGHRHRHHAKYRRASERAEAARLGLPQPRS